MTVPESASREVGIAAGPRLRRELGVFGATMMGLGAILGTGVFVSLGIAAGVAGPAVLVAIGLAAGLATCNALSSAQLAASHPVSGGTYEYGYRYLRPWLGFSAGWMFLCAKSASAATAALGFAGYLLNTLGMGQDGWGLTLLAAGTVVAVTALVLTGMRRSNRANIAIVGVTVASLLLFVLAGLPLALRAGGNHLTTWEGTAAAESFWPALAQATALMFVAYTGYGRIATLSEEVRNPQRTIPRAIITTLAVSATLYLAVGAVAIAAVGAGALGDITRTEAAPLEIAAGAFDVPQVRYAVAVGAMTAMLGVLLNLILGLSRVLLAMGRRGDMPVATARLDRAQVTPYAAVIVVGLIVLGLSLIGSVKLTWSFAAFTVLIYYAITNAAALALPPGRRLYPRWIAWVGLVACVFLSLWVEVRVALVGLGVLGIGLVWFGIARRLRRAA